MHNTNRKLKLIIFTLSVLVLSISVVYGLENFHIEFNNIEVCWDCHNVTEDNKWFKKKGGIILYNYLECKGCHRPLDKTGHPLGPGPGDLPELPRDEDDRLLCMECHNGHKDHKLRLFSENMCLDCHRTGLQNMHPVGVVPKQNVPEELPLSIEGKVTCQTCHKVHMDHEKVISYGLFGMLSKEVKTYFLRIDNSKGSLCKACHPEK